MRTTLPSTEELLSALHGAGLLSAAQVHHFAAAWGADADPRRCAGQLIEAGLLTPFQAEQVLAGKARRLVLGPYVLLERLGAGGMGQVYKAEHRLMKRVAAVKVLARRRRGSERPRSARGAYPSRCREPSGTPERPRSARGAYREVQATARLRHPNIVTAYDAAEARGLFYLAMEFVEGIDLQRRVDEGGPLPVPLACAIIRQTAAALQYAHAQGLVHRDVKPANLLLVEAGAPVDDGRAAGFIPAVRPNTAGVNPAARPEPVLVKLLDLGLARLAEQPASGMERQDEADEELSGTPDFMAPEWAQTPQETDVRGDLYSLGCTFYFLLTGRVPYPGGGWREKLLRHSLDTPVSVRDLRPDVPAEIAAVVERLMARDLEQRYPTAGAVAGDLDTWRAGGVSPLMTPDIRGLTPPARRRFALAALGAVLLGVLMAWGARWVVRASAESPAVPIETSAPPFQIEGRPGGFATLEQAIAAAHDADIVTVHAAGPFRTTPLVLQGKALTIRAAPSPSPLPPGERERVRGTRPRLEVTAAAGDPWRGLFTTDRTLTVEGLELAAPGGAPLVCSERAPLRLTDCRLLAGGVAVIARNAGEVDVRGCRIEAEHVGLSVEVGQTDRCRLRLEDSTLTVREPAAAALSLWAPEVRQPTPIDLHLERNTIHGGRVTALRALPHTLAITAHGNRFRFRQALLSFTDCPEPDAWRRGTTWQGGDNSYDGPASWLWVEGRPISPTDLRRAALPTSPSE